MKTTLTLILSVLMSTLAYTDLDDNFDFEHLVKDRKLLVGYLNCLFDRGPCSPAIEHYKSHTLEAITDGCRECNQVEAHLLRIFLEGLKENYPEGYAEYMKKYDPDGSRQTMLMEKIKSF